MLVDASCQCSADLSYKELSGRPKNLWGVHNKMQQKRQKLDSIYDLRAIRVIVRDKTDCYAVLRQVRNTQSCMSEVPCWTLRFTYPAACSTMARFWSELYL